MADNGRMFRILRNFSKVLTLNDYLQEIKKQLSEKNFRKSLELILEAQQKFPTSLVLKKLECKVLIELGYYQSALKQLKKLHILEPTNAEILLLMGLSYLKLGLIAESQQVFNYILQKADNQQKNILLKQISKIYSQNYRYDLAINYLQKLLESNPKDYTVIWDLAMLYFQNLDFYQSEKFLKIYLQANPFSKKGWYYLGILFFKQNKISKAIEALDFALAIDPNFKQALIVQATLYFMLENFDKAIEYLDKISSFDSNDLNALFLYSVILLKNKKYKQAIKVLLKIIKLNRRFSYPYYLLSKLLKNKNLQLSKKFLAYALKYDKNNSKFWFLAAEIFYKEKNIFLSEKFFKSALIINPFKERYWFEYSNLLVQQKNYDKAIRLLKISQFYIQNYSSIFKRIAEIFELKGDFSQASLYMRRYKQMIDT